MRRTVPRKFLRETSAVAAVFLVALGTGSLGAEPEPPNPSIEVVPSNIELPATGEKTVVVAVRNSSTERLEAAHLSHFENVALRVTSKPTGSQELLPNGVAVWTLKLTREGAGLTAGTMHLQLDYAWSGPPTEAGGPKVTTPRVAFAAVEIKSPTVTALQPLATVELKTAAESISERRDGHIYVVITNRSGVRIEVRSIKTVHPTFVTVVPDSVETPTQLEPGAVTLVEFKARAQPLLQPGKQTFLFKVTLNSVEGEQVVLASQDLNVSVFGEAEFSGPIGAPAFLVLPGIIMVWMWGLLSRTFGSVSLQPPAALKSSDGIKSLATDGAMSVALSILMAFVLYPGFTGALSRLGSGVPARSYLDGYGTSDLAIVWGLSIIFAALVWAAVKLMDWYRNWMKERLTPSPRDFPLVIVRKLGRQGLPNLLTKVVSSGRQGFLLERRGSSTVKDGYWVGPGIEIRFRPQQREGGPKPKDRAPLSELNSLLTSKGTLEKIAKALEKCVNLHAVEVKYTVDGWQGPEHGQAELRAEQAMFVTRR